jgi:hypothetical protein
MPLPSVLNGAKQCQVMTKRTKLRCKNPAAYDCKACRMHGAHKSKNVLRDKNHPQYKNGGETLEAKKNRSKKSATLLYLRDIGDTVQLFNGIKTRGRKPKTYLKLDLTQPENMRYVIWKILKECD